MNCLIVDDEPLARQGMRSLIEEISNLEILGQFSNAPAALEFIKSNHVDLIFLDIQMPRVTGLEFAEQVSESTLVIFTTAYAKYAIKSYELDAIDYLLKPIDKERLKKAIAKAETYKKMLSEGDAINTLEGSTNDFLFIKSDRRYYKISFRDIRFIEGLKDYVVIYTATQKLITAMNLKTIHSRITANNFIRVSKSYVINMDYIDSFDSYTIYMGESEIPIGEVYKKDFFQRYTGDFLSSEE
ncbi:MAG TPA: LytTR family DNA-binding domain-containing protein [Chitinophaga sp.]